MSDDFVKKNRDAAKAFLKAYVQAVRFSNSNVQQAKESWAKISRNNAVLKMTALPYVPDDAKLDIDALGFDIKVLKRFGYLKKDLNPMDTIDYSVLDEVLAGK